ncbi:MAG: hypothetical protein NXI27_12000 [Alphaproteobacteria bacterium]|nr:hypothetical protein [Alphaproteobacteria bacterium]
MNRIRSVGVCGFAERDAIEGVFGGVEWSEGRSLMKRRKPCDVAQAAFFS